MFHYVWYTFVLLVVWSPPYLIAARITRTWPFNKKAPRGTTAPGASRSPEDPAE